MWQGEIIYPDHVTHLQVILLVPTHCYNQNITLGTNLFCILVMLVFSMTLYGLFLKWHRSRPPGVQPCARKIRGTLEKKIPDNNYQFPTSLQSIKKFNKEYSIVNIMNSSTKIFDFLKPLIYLLRQQQQQFIHIHKKAKPAQQCEGIQTINIEKRCYATCSCKNIYPKYWSKIE